MDALPLKELRASINLASFALNHIENLSSAVIIIIKTLVSCCTVVANQVLKSIYSRQRLIYEETLITSWCGSAKPGVTDDYCFLQRHVIFVRPPNRNPLTDDDDNKILPN